MATAASCCEEPRGIETFAGVTAIETNDACPTARVVEADIEPKVGVMVVAPTPALVASRLLPAALLMIATGEDEEFQVTREVTSCVVPSV